MVLLGGIKVKKNVRKKEYEIQEAVSYYILGYKRYERNKEQDGLKGILRNILEIAQESLNIGWFLSANDFIAYATCVFYVLINREIQITDEKIVKEFLSEIHSHHPRKIMKEAEIILDNLL